MSMLRTFFERENRTIIMLICRRFSGMMTKNEHQLYEQVSSKNVKYWVPILWFNNLVSKARQDGRVYDDMIYSLIIKVS